MKKLISLLLAMLMVFSLATTAFADEVIDPAEETEPTVELGSITINGISGDPKVTYEVYRLLDLESYDVTAGAYSYKVNADWTGFFIGGEGAAYVTIDDAGYVTWTGAEDADTIADFAKMALAYAEANGIDPVKSSKNDGEFTVTETTGKFNDLPLGWYLVDSTVGALCGLTTTNPDASINAKNGAPTIDKQVQEDSTGQYGDTNTADVGQIVYFRTTINVHAGAQAYVLHDTMSNGLTFVQDTTPEGEEDDRGVYRVELVRNGVTSTVAVDKYDVVIADLDDDCTFHVVFDQDYCDDLETNDKLIVYYNAMLNRDAVVGDDGDGNPNTTRLEYGENNTTTTDSTTTYTFSFDIVKTDSQNTLIDGAEFKIYDAENGGNEIGVVVLTDAETGEVVVDDNNNPIYRRAREDEMEEDKNVPILVKGGKVTVIGFDNGTYWLEETKAPDGYNKLTARQKFIISDANLDSIFNGDIYSTGSGVHVVNKTGSMLPETGGMGTVMFITFGTFTVLAAGVLLVTKKRMTMIQD